MRGHEQDPSAGVLDVKFHDTGVGIPRENLRRIFDPFFSRRADGGTGSGLGLPVSLAMVKSIGGEIQVTSVEEIGTTVTVSLPIVERRTQRRKGAPNG
jgi:two-component system NtrC family sensor kinase